MSNTRTSFVEYTVEAWHTEGVHRFGADQMAWLFVCPCCGHVATAADWKAAGAPSSAVGFSCVGRWMESSREAFGGKGPGPCNYAGGGLFCVSPVAVVVDGKKVRLFAFAEVDE